jgi:hypothetical protein
LRTNQFVAEVVFSVATFLDFALQHLHPAPVARVVVNGTVTARIPAQKQQCVAFVICGDQVACVVTRRVKVSEFYPVALVQSQTAAE